MKRMNRDFNRQSCAKEEPSDGVFCGAMKSLKIENDED